MPVNLHNAKFAIYLPQLGHLYAMGTFVATPHTKDATRYELTVTPYSKKKEQQTFQVEFLFSAEAEIIISKSKVDGVVAAEVSAIGHMLPTLTSKENPLGRRRIWFGGPGANSMYVELLGDEDLGPSHNGEKPRKA